MTRSNMIEVLNLTISARLGPRASRSARWWASTLRNILVPVMTVIGAQLGGLIGNAVVVGDSFSTGPWKLALSRPFYRRITPVQAFTVVSVLYLHGHQPDTGHPVRRG